MIKLSEIIEEPISGEWGTEDETGMGIPVLRTTNFTNDGFIDFSNVVTRNISGIHKKTNKFLRYGDIIIEKSGGSPTQPVGRVVYYDGEDNKFLINNFTSILRVRNVDEVYHKFLFYNLLHKYRRGETRRFQNKTTGILNLKLNRFVDETRIRLPLPDIQKQIAHELDTVSKLLALRKQQLEELDQLIKSVFYEMFGDPVINEKGWEVRTVESLCKNIFGGGTPSKRVKEYYQGNIPWVTPKDMKSYWITESEDHINEIAIKNSSTKLVPSNSLLMVIRSGILKHTLPVAINSREVTINQDLKAFIFTSEVSVQYMLYLFKMLERFILSRVRSVTADNIEFNSIKKLFVPVPPTSLQNKFADIVTQIEAQKSLVKQSIDETQLLFDSLMSKYFDD